MDDKNKAPNLKRAKWMICIVSVGLLISGVTVWPAVAEMEFLVSLLWGDTLPSNTLHKLALETIEAVEHVDEAYPFLLYAHDWLAFAHIVLAILFLGTVRDPVRNKWTLQCGLIMCALVPVLASICVPIRELPLFWILIDSSFAPAAAIPLWIALREVNRAEEQVDKKVS